MSPLLSRLDDLVLRYPDLAPIRDSVLAAHGVLFGAVGRGGKIMMCGNGGSAADASHWSAELLKSLAKRRPLSELERARFGDDGADLADRLEGAIPAISLNDLGAIHSAFANDVGAEYALAQLVWALGRPGDALVGISTSGNSANVIHALRVARANGIATVGLVGRDGGRMKAFCDVAIVAPGADTQQIQERHLPIYHALSLMLEEALF